MGNEIAGKKVDIFLKTPLYRFKYLVEGKERQLIENIVRIEGKVLELHDAGLLVEVKNLSNQKERQQDLPFETIFLPFEKVDFMVVR